ncbi:MAG: UDP-N-acetylmuramoyl-tripeptide--D-alanyl-D-alanine ligase, partial [Gammaproteobacteria bacterium]
MIEMSLSEAAAVLSARRDGADRRFRGVSIDTRTLEQGALYVAIPGEHVDGHDFVGEAARRGAVAALAMRAEGTGLPTLIVSNTRAALGPLAAAWRARFALPVSAVDGRPRSGVTVVAVTGSNGKTTVKEMIAAALRTTGPVLATRGNLNNDVGMPLTLFELGPEHVAAVIEMGANHAGEIEYLSTIAKPDVAVITNCGPAHLEGFGTIEDVARAKGEIVSGLSSEGTAVLNADDAYFDLWRELAGSRTVVSFGLDARADVTARWRADAGASVLDLDLAGQRVEVRQQLLG